MCNSLTNGHLNFWKYDAVLLHQVYNNKSDSFYLAANDFKVLLSFYFVRSKKKVKLPNLHFHHLRMEKLKESDNGNTIEQYEAVVAGYSKVPSQLGHNWLLTYFWYQWYGLY